MMRMAETEPLEQVLYKSPFSWPCQAFPFSFSCQGTFTNCKWISSSHSGVATYDKWLLQTKEEGANFLVTGVFRNSCFGEWQKRWVRWKGRGRVRSAYFHHYDEGHLGGKDMPELHVMGILVLMIRRVPVISVPTKQRIRPKMNMDRETYIERWFMPHRCDR